MAKKKTSTAFDNAFNSLGLSNPEGGESIVNLDDLGLDDPDTTIVQGDDNIDNPDGNEPPVDGNEPPKNDDKSADGLGDDVNLPPAGNEPPASTDDIDDNNDGDGVEDPNDDPNGDANEATQVGAFFDAFAEELGWEVDDDEKPTSIDGLIEYIQDVVEENSKPQYSDERIARLDEYVRNGGNFDDFYNNMSQDIQYEKLDIEDEDNQKLAVKDYLRLSGYTEEQINRKIERYEDAGVLEDEASDAIERLKIYKQQQIEQQQKAQEQYRMQQEQQAMEFVNSLNNTITNLKTIRGVNIPKEDRKLLFDYITKVDATGQTQYQKDFNKNMVNNLIESAYFTMKGDALISEATKNGQTTAANKLRQMLRHSQKNHSTYNIDDKKRSVADIASMWYH